MADIYFDVDTALSEVPVNIFPLTDDTDFKTREVSIAYDAAGMDLVWNFVTTAGAYTQSAVTPTTGGTYDWVHQGDGMYSIEIPASGGASINNDTEGFGWFTGVCTGVLPWRSPVFGFRAAGINDILIDSAFSTTRGLAGTALPAAAADAAGGLPISDAGGLDIDTLLSTLTNATYGLSAIETLVDDIESRLTATRAGYLDNLSAGVVPTAAQNADAVWDEVLTGVTHNVINSAGRKLRQVESHIVLVGISPNTGGTANTAIRIELAADASSVSGTYDPGVIYISAGTGIGQSRQIFEYDGDNKYAYVNRDWKVIPDNTSEYTILANFGDTHINEGLARGGANMSITLNTIASDVDDTYNNQVVFITAGTGQDQARKITAYNGTTKVATVDTAWETNPDSGSIYAVLPVYNASEGDATSANQLIIIDHLTDVKGATFSEATDSLEAIRNRGDAAWITGGGLSGSNEITITVQDDSAVNILEASVEIWDEVGRAFYEKKFSNSSGQAVFNLDNGTYTIKIHKAGYSYENTALTVSAAAAVTCEMTAYVVPSPASADLCRIYTYIIKGDGTKYSAITSTATVPLYDNDNNLVSGQISGVYNATTGLLYFDLIRGIKAGISISNISYNKTVNVPNLETAKLDEI